MTRIGLILLAVIATFVVSMLVIGKIKEAQLTDYQRDQLNETRSCIRATTQAWKSVGLTDKQRIILEDFRVCAPIPVFILIAFLVIRKYWSEQ